MKQILILLTFVVSTTIYSQEFEKGKEIFTANCAGCHNMEKKVVGPPLENTIEAQGREWTSKWIVNNIELRASGDAHANEIYNEYNQQAMPGFEYLKSEDLNSLLDYMEGFKKNKEEKASVVPSPSVGGVQPTSAGSGSTIPTYLWIIIVVVLAILLLAAITIVTSLKLLDSYFAKITITNSQLIKKMNLDSKQVDDNVEKIFEKEVEKRVKDKVKTLRDGIDNNLKNFK